MSKEFDFRFEHALHYASLIKPRGPHHLSSLLNLEPIPRTCLDAPSLCDDFYINVLSWSSQDIVAVGLDDSVYVDSLSARSVTRLFKEFGSYITSVKWAGKEVPNTLAVGNDSDLVTVWDTVSMEKTLSLQGPEDSRFTGDIDWHGPQLAAGFGGGTVKLFDIRTPQTVLSINAHTRKVCGVKWNGHLLATGADDNFSLCWDLRSMGHGGKVDKRGLHEPLWRWPQKGCVKVSRFPMS